MHDAEQFLWPRHLSHTQGYYIQRDIPDCIHTVLHDRDQILLWRENIPYNVKQDPECSTLSLLGYK
jgi:hypothetical protein